MKYPAITILITSLSLLPARAAVFYVNNAGTPACADGNAGTSAAAPLCTLAAAMAKANASDGNTVKVAEGTSYTNPGLIDIQKRNVTWTSYDIDGNGSAGKWTLSTPNRYLAFFVGRNGTPGDNATIENVTVDNVGNFDGTQFNGVIFIQSRGATIRNVDIKRPSDNGQANYGTAAAIHIGAYNYLIDKLSVSGKFGTGIAIIGNGGVYPGWNGSSWAQCPTASNMTTACGAPNTYADPFDCDPTLATRIKGGTIRNSAMAFQTNDGTSYGCFFVEGIGDARVSESHKPVHNIYNTSCVWTNTATVPTRAMYLRGSYDKINFFNNYFYGFPNMVFFQETGDGTPGFNFACNASSCPDGASSISVCSCLVQGQEYYKFFNNAFVSGPTVRDGGNGGAISYVHCIDADFINNVFLNYGHAFRLFQPSQGDSWCQRRSGHGEGNYCIDHGRINKTRIASIRNNIFYNGRQDGHVQIWNGSSGSLGDSGCSGTDQMSCINNIYDLPDDGIDPNPRLTADGHLQPGSYAIDRGFNNVLGQGPNLCSLLDGISCMLDKDGDLRPLGGGWDIGLDESGGAPLAIPPPPSGLTRTDR